MTFTLESPWQTAFRKWKKTNEATEIQFPVPKMDRAFDPKGYMRVLACSVEKAVELAFRGGWECCEGSEGDVPEKGEQQLEE